MDNYFLRSFFEARISRRMALKAGLASAAGAALSDMLAFNAFAADAAVAAPSGKAKAVIQIWLAGGPSHLDTFDPKPKAGNDYCGPYTKPVQTNVPGIQICQMLPLLAAQADKYSLLRGMTHGINGHETAAYLVQTGRKQGGDGLVYPGLGAVLSYFRGYKAGYKGMIPPYITVTGLQGRFSESGFLGPSYKPFATGGDPNRDPFAVEGVIAENITEERQRGRKALLEELDSFSSEMSSDPLVSQMNANQEKAYSMILGDAGKVFVLSQEKPEAREKYGRSKFGQSCLLARRLVEQGVPYITINHGGWDTHKRHFEEMNKKLPEIDKGISALLQDLAERGLLDSTIVWVCGEFGRTPKIQWEEPWNGGRGHYGKAFSALVAGGGFKGGQVVGETDDKGETVVKRPVYPWDLLESMRSLLGIDPQAQLLSPQGQKLYVSPFASKEVPEKETGGVLKEIM